MILIEYIGWAMMLVIGFFLGLLVATFADMFDLGLGPVVLLMLGFMVLALVWDTVAHFLRFGIWDRLFGIKKTQADRESRRYSRYCLAAGLPIGFIAAQIWEPAAIMEAMPWT